MKFPATKFRLICSAALLCNLSACAFFETPLDDPGIAAPPAPNQPTLQPAPPPLPTPSQNNQLTSLASSSTGTYFVVSTIFEVPENIPNLSFVHFTDRNNRRETATCEALLNAHPITRPAEVPTDARSLIIWPVVEGSSATNCRSMIRAHEPLDLSNETAAIVNSDGPYLMSRNTPQQKQMIYDLSSVARGDIAGTLTQWEQVLGSDVQNWPPLVKVP